MENENKMYGYYISFEYAREVFSFDFFGTNASPIFGSANLNYNKPLEKFLMKDYEEVRKMIATSLNENLNKKLKEEEKRDKYTKDNIIIINIIPTKYEVLNGESD